MGLRRVEKYRKLLVALPSLNKLQLKSVVKNSKNDFIQCLCEVVENILRGNIPLTKTQKRNLNRYKNSLRQIGCKRVSIATKKKILTHNQKGGFIQFIIPPLLAIAGTLAARGIAKKIGI